MKTEWVLNKTYEKLYRKAVALIKKDAYMKFYHDKDLLYFETDTFGVGLGEGLLQEREGMNYPHDEAGEITAM